MSHRRSRQLRPRMRSHSGPQSAPLFRVMNSDFGCLSKWRAVSGDNGRRPTGPPAHAPVASDRSVADLVIRYDRPRRKDCSHHPDAAATKHSVVRRCAGHGRTISAAVARPDPPCYLAHFRLTERWREFTQEGHIPRLARGVEGGTMATQTLERTLPTGRRGVQDRVEKVVGAHGQVELEYRRRRGRVR